MTADLYSFLISLTKSEIRRSGLRMLDERAKNEVQNRATDFHCENHAQNTSMALGTAVINIIFAVPKDRTAPDES